MLVQLFRPGQLFAAQRAAHFVVDVDIRVHEQIVERLECLGAVVARERRLDVLVRSNVPRQMVAEQKRLGAQATRERPTARVLRHMARQLGGCGEALVAVLALERLVGQMLDLVPFEALLEREALVAMGALERPTLSMVELVLLQVGHDQERLVAERAHKVRHVRVQSFVARQQCGARKALVAHAARERLHIRVRGHVLGQIVFAEERVAAVVALADAVLVVLDHVHVEQLLQHERAVALRTRKHVGGHLGHSGAAVVGLLEHQFHAAVLVGLEVGRLEVLGAGVEHF